ncbi:class I histocompatibility antigen, Gogo-B*0101 alpha chain-like isoform X4 [Pseudophryne corroboree]|uniref:class I histocompatibility antigen, Gogo-B*0101 alpha chain-like isoform X4 n=1 Tax=Pseudophryne corroboree TaxID=495146 RepID=UPI0030819B8B
MSPLFLLILGVSGVCSDSHMLRYYMTGVSDRGSGLPEYSLVGYVDDKEIVHYSSDSRLVLPVAPWMRKVEPEYWERNTLIGRSNEAISKHDVRTVMSRFNQTGGLHSVQRMHGCELRDDGSTAGYRQYGYDGRDFLHLDTERWIYIPTMHEAQITAQRWNSPDVREIESNRIYLQDECIEWLKIHINNGREDLEKRVAPEVKVTGHRSGEVTKLRCQVYGFHPRAVDVKWMRDEQDEVLSVEASRILPHPDGTYQIRVTVEVPAGEEERYSCHVDHSSLEKTLSVKWEPRSGPSVGVIIGAVIGGLAVLALVIGAVLIYRRRNSDYKTTSNGGATQRRNAERCCCHRPGRSPPVTLLVFCLYSNTIHSYTSLSLYSNTIHSYTSLSHLHYTSAEPIQ